MNGNSKERSNQNTSWKRICPSKLEVLRTGHNSSIDRYNPVAFIHGERDCGNKPIKAVKVIVFSPF